MNQPITTMKIKKELTVNPILVNVILIPPVILLVILMPMLAEWIQGPTAYETWTYDSFLLKVVIIIIGVLLHEALHGFTWMKLGNLRLEDISYGFIWKALMPYAHSKKPLSKRAYQIGAAVPGLVLGVIPYTLSLVFPSPELLWLGIFFTAAAGGDAWILWMIRNEPKNALILDHPNLPGCYVIDSETPTYQAA